MPKRNNLHRKDCPLCGHEFMLKDKQLPFKTFEQMFDYHDINFYGGNVKKFTEGKCCFEYILYWKDDPRQSPATTLVDIEPIDFEKFKVELEKAIKRDEKAAKEAEERRIIENYDNMYPAQLRKIANEQFGGDFPKTAKKADLLEYIHEQG